LHKHPQRAQTFSLSFGRAHVFYPEANDARCTAALLLDIDPIGLVRGRRDGGLLEQYVNDRPYIASSFMSVAIAQVFGSALAGRSKDRLALVDQALPLQARLSVAPCRGGAGLIDRLFEPLGYAVKVQGYRLDEQFPAWGQSRYYTVELEARCRLQDLLSHLYVLIPVLDDEKHYYVGEDEVEKLLRHGGAWLSTHPEREPIVDRYLKHKRRLRDQALERLLEEDTRDDVDDGSSALDEEMLERRETLHELRLGAVLSVLKNARARRVLDLGCGEGRLLKLLAADKSFDEIVGMDVSHRALEMAADRLHLDRLPERQKDRVKLIHGSLLYRDKRLAGFDAAAVVEVIEHLDAPRLAAFERALFEYARPALVVLTTPNVEFNVLFDTLPAGQLRHRDHRFEWTRAEFEAWANGIARRYGYAARLMPIGPEHEQYGAPTQMGVFTR
jgi:3' terminal RNA ribose 2'-O-methyltransferase Hen1